MATIWKRGRGKLGALQPLLGRWQAEADSQLGPARCARVFERILAESYIQLTATWEIGTERKAYQEVALFGVGGSGAMELWSFTSDGKRSHGRLADVSDLHAEAIGFEAQMPAGLARQAYWPTADGAIIWVVESRNARGWNRFTEHCYRPT